MCTKSNHNLGFFFCVGFRRFSYSLSGVGNEDIITIIQRTLQEVYHRRVKDHSDYIDTMATTPLTDAKKQYVWLIRYGKTEFPLVENEGPYDSKFNMMIPMMQTTM